MKKLIIVLLVVSVLCSIGLMFSGCKLNKKIKPSDIINDTPPDMLPDYGVTRLEAQEFLKKGLEHRLMFIKNEYMATKNLNTKLK